MGNCNFLHLFLHFVASDGVFYWTPLDKNNITKPGNKSDLSKHGSALISIQFWGQSCITSQYLSDLTYTDLSCRGDANSFHPSDLINIPRSLNHHRKNRLDYHVFGLLDKNQTCFYFGRLQKGNRRPQPDFNHGQCGYVSCTVTIQLPGCSSVISYNIKQSITNGKMHLCKPKYNNTLYYLL